MTDSSIGFGHNPYGHNPYGFGDWAEEMLWRNMPEVYKDCDEAGPAGSVVESPLRKFQNALKPSYQDIRIKWHQFPSLWDAIRVPLDQLPQLGYNVGINVDPTKSEGLQRSSVLNASQLWINKGNDKGYEVTAAFEGLLVTITPLWALTCGPASLDLGAISALCDCFDLSTTQLQPLPVSPETLHITVTTSYGIVEDIRDDGVGGLVGSGNQASGPLNRFSIISAVTLELTNIIGVILVGDTITQGGTSGTALAFSGSTLVVRPLVGVFGAGAVGALPSGATADISSTASEVMSPNETLEGLTSGTTAIVRDFQNTYAIIDRITTLAGFTTGETLLGLTSGKYAVAGATTTPLLQGPLRAKIMVGSVVGAFTASDELTGSAAGVTGVLRVIDGTAFWIDTITQPGFIVGETLSLGANTAVVLSIDFGSIDYISGLMTGQTVSLQANSTIESVVELSVTGPTQFLPSYDLTPADLIPMDDIRSDRYERWPTTYIPVRVKNGILTPGECRSHSLRLYFFTQDNTEIEDFIGVAGRISLAIEQFRPIHVQFDKISFDGARASSQVWRTGKVSADSSAASVWTTSVTGNQLASSQVWTTGPFSATVAT